MQSNQLRFLHAAAIAGLLGGWHAAAHAEPSAATGAAAHVDETQRTEAALLAIVHHWDRAELDGDVAFLDQLLVPEYRSIDAKGASHMRAKILEHARRNAGSAAAQKEVDAFKQAHPTEIAVVIRGDVGITSYFNPHRGLDDSTRGADIFVYEGKRWHAVYSLHNGAE